MLLTRSTRPAARARVLVLVLVLAAGGCGDDGGADAPVACRVGDPSQPLALELVVQLGGLARVIRDGDQVPLIRPPQGGFIIPVSARVSNLDGCQVILTSALRDPCGDRVLGLETRPVLLVDGGDGWASPAQPGELSNYGNPAVCPSAAASRDVDGDLLRLEVRVADLRGRQAEAAIRVTPYCAEPGLAATCACECDGDYQLGAACPTEIDGGVPGCPVDAGAGAAVDAGVDAP